VTKAPHLSSQSRASTFTRTHVNPLKERKVLLCLGANCSKEHEVTRVRASHQGAQGRPLSSPHPRKAGIMESSSPQLAETRRTQRASCTPGLPRDQQAHKVQSADPALAIVGPGGLELCPGFWIEGGQPSMLCNQPAHHVLSCCTC
jgi:hypothetical protein